MSLTCRDCGAYNDDKPDDLCPGCREERYGDEGLDEERIETERDELEEVDAFPPDMEEED